MLLKYNSYKRGTDMVIKINKKIFIKHQFIISNSQSTTKSIKLPIIMYHQVKKDKLNQHTISPIEFEDDLIYIKENGYTTITMIDLINYVYNNQSLPEKPIILSFDDGFYNNYVYVIPLLKKYNMKIVMSIVGKSTDDFSKTNDENLDYSHVTWDQVNELIKSNLVEIQNHSYNLHTANKRYGSNKKQGETLTEYEKALTDDVGKCQQEIINNTGGYTPNTFTYPYGSICSDSITILKKIGFKATLSCDYGINFINKDPDNLYCLRRISRYHNYSISKLLSDVDKLKSQIKYR
jgi:peptidoglycan/xylan/chitin deacetylase (PgdA/CDA1 family)